MPPIQRKEYLILAAILIFGFFLRVYKLDTYSIFFDEKSTMVVSQGLVLDGSNQKEIFLAPTFTPEQFWASKTYDDYLEAMARSDIGNSSFYYLLLHYWLEIFGLSDFSARFFSVIFSVLIIGLTFIFARRFFSTQTGLIAAAIVAIEPFFIAYSHQARNYSLTFFLTLAATYYFLRIIDEKQDDRNKMALYAGYALTAGLGLLSHFLTISVLLAHALYAVFFLKGIKNWVRMAIAGVVAMSGVTWWMTLGGGQWTLSNLKGQAELYKKMAETQNGTYGNVLPATLKNVVIKSLPIFSDLIIFTNGLTDALGGKKNIIVAILSGIVLIIWYRLGKRINLNPVLKAAIPFLIITAGIAFYSTHKFQFLILSVAIFALSFLYDLHVTSSAKRRNRLWLLYVMGLIPTLFLITMSFKNGHTYGLTQRYSGFSFPYVIILLSLLLQQFRSLDKTLQLLIFSALAIQFYFVGQRLKEFYQDRSLKYGYFAEPRPSNPFYAAAGKIKAVYQEGDTIVYPAKPNIIMREMDRNFLDYRVRDAQLTNLYLPKDAKYVQRINPKEPDRIIIRRNNQTLEIINLRGLRAGDD